MERSISSDGLNVHNLNPFPGQFSNYQPVSYEAAYGNGGNNPTGSNLSGDAREDLFFL